MADDPKRVPMFDPSGTIRMVREDQVDAALAAGGHHAVEMVDPKGTHRWVRDGQVQDAIQAGGKLAGDQPGAIARFLSSAIDASGLHDIFHPSEAPAPLEELKAHPVATIARALAGPAGMAAEGAYQGAKRIAGEGVEAYKAGREGNLAGVGSHVVSGLPFVGPVIDKAEDQYGSGDYAGEAGTLIGAVAPFLLGTEEAEGAAGKAVDVAKRVPEASRQGARAFKQTTHPRNMALTEHEAATQEFIKALNPPVGAEGKIPEDIESSAEEIPHARAYAAKHKIPLNGKLDFGKAADAAGQEIQDHFDEVIHKPHSGKFQSVPRSYGGEMSGNGVNQATLGQINDRINVIRERLNAKAKPTTQDDFALRSEARQLTQILHKSLGEMNGMDPEDVASLRQRAGKLRTLAEQSRMSAARDTAAAAGRESGRTGAASVLRPLDTVMDAVGGGPEVTGNRIFKNALDKFEPKEVPLPEPNPPAPEAPPSRVPAWTGPASGPPADASVPPPDAGAVQSVADKFRARVDANRTAQAARDAAAAANREAARLEALKAYELEQSAQDAASGRSAAVDTYRDEQAAGNKKVAEQEVLKAHELDTAAQDAAASRGNAAQDARQSNATADADQKLAEGAALRETGRMRVAAAKGGDGPTIETREVVPADPARGVQSVSLPEKVPAPDNPPMPHAGTHVFSKSAFADANPQADVDAAAEEARQAGFEVQE